jgi:hypothetical protein
VQHNVFVFGMPRTGTTVVQTLLSERYNIPNAAEPFAPEKYLFDSIDQVLDWTTQHRPCVIKVLSGQKYFESIDLMLDQDSGAKLFLCERKNLTDACISLNVVKLTGQFHFAIKPDLSHLGTVKIPLDHVYYWLSDIYRPYCNIIRTWQEQGRELVKLCYEDLVKQNELEIEGSRIKISGFPFVNSEIDYVKLCSNYQQVQDLILNFRV